MHGIIISTKLVNKEDNRIAALLKIGGITLLERQARMMVKNGILQVIIIVLEENNEILKEVERLKELKLNIDIIKPGKDGKIESLLTYEKYQNKNWILMDGSMLFDSRLPKMLSDSGKEKICVIPDKSAIFNKDSAPKLILKDESFIFAGCARLSDKTIEAFKFNDSGHWLKSLQNIVTADSKKVLNLSLEKIYSVDMRRDLPFLVFPITSSEDNKSAKRLLIDAAQKKILDWPAWFVHRPIENWIIYHICEWTITPNQITVISLVTAFISLYFFASGQIRIGLILALTVGILDGLDGKQARVKFMTSKLGEVEHTLDKINENGWYFAMAYSLNIQGYGIIPWILFSTISLTNLLNIVINANFRSKFNIQFDNYGSVERKFRWISGRQNTYIWTLIPFVFLDAFYLGYWTIALYAIITFSFRTWRFFLHLSRAIENERAP